MLCERAKHALVKPPRQVAQKESLPPEDAFFLQVTLFCASEPDGVWPTIWQEDLAKVIKHEPVKTNQHPLHCLKTVVAVEFVAQLFVLELMDFPL